MQRSRRANSAWASDSHLADAMRVGNRLCADVWRQVAHRHRAHQLLLLPRRIRRLPPPLLRRPLRRGEEAFTGWGCLGRPRCRCLGPACGCWSLPHSSFRSCCRGWGCACGWRRHFALFSPFPLLVLALCEWRPPLCCLHLHAGGAKFSCWSQACEAARPCCMYVRRGCNALCRAVQTWTVRPPSFLPSYSRMARSASSGSAKVTKPQPCA